MQIIAKIDKAYWLLKTQLVYKWKFNKINSHTQIIAPLRLDETRSVVVNKHVFISYGAWIMGNQEKECTLVISSGTNIGNYSHIVAKYNVIIEKDVLIADKVFISDCTHIYEDISMPIKKQQIRKLGDVVIGEGTWIGENVCVLGAKIGKHCVIGANAVVNKDIPDYCIAVGNPATIIKQYNFQNKTWDKVTS